MKLKVTYLLVSFGAALGWAQASIPITSCDGAIFASNTSYALANDITPDKGLGCLLINGVTNVRVDLNGHNIIYNGGFGAIGVHQSPGTTIMDSSSKYGIVPGVIVTAGSDNTIVASVTLTSGSIGQTSTGVSFVNDKFEGTYQNRVINFTNCTSCRVATSTNLGLVVLQGSPSMAFIADSFDSDLAGVGLFIGPGSPGGTVTLAKFSNCLYACVEHVTLMDAWTITLSTFSNSNAIGIGGWLSMSMRNTKIVGNTFDHVVQAFAYTFYDGTSSGWPVPSPLIWSGNDIGQNWISDPIDCTHWTSQGQQCQGLATVTNGGLFLLPPGQLANGTPYSFTIQDNQLYGNNFGQSPTTPPAFSALANVPLTRPFDGGRNVCTEPPSGEPYSAPGQNYPLNCR